jgi:hypothetical protein
MKRPSSYKPTFFDRHGPAGEVRLKAIGYGLMVFGIVVGATMLVSAIGGINIMKPVPMTLTLLAALTLGSFTSAGGLRLSEAAGDAAKFFTAGSNSSTPYEDQFSEEQALVMRREYGQAADLFEHRIARNPGDPRVLMAAADLYATHCENPKRAAELYRQVQKLPDVGSGQDVYVSNKLADLYLGPLKEPRRALVEFRRLIECYPGSVAAQHAKAALEKLKADLMTNGDEKPGNDQGGSSDYKVW